MTPHDHDHDHDHPHDHPHRAMHDLGGEPRGEIVIADHVPDAFDKDVDALVNLLALKEVGLVRPDERRRGIEELPPEIYFAAAYYERWLFGVTGILLEKQLLTADEITDEMARLAREDGR